MIALIVFQQDIVFWGVLLNEAAFQNKRLKLASHHDIVKILDIFYHAAHFFGMARIVRLEILADTVFEVFGLADIYDFPFFILHEIDAGVMCQIACLFAEPVEIWIHSFSSKYKFKYRVRLA